MEVLGAVVGFDMRLCYIDRYRRGDVVSLARSRHGDCVRFDKLDMEIMLLGRI